MKLNENTAISTSKVLLVPYDRRHVLRYHEWMSDPAIQEATASEPLTLEEEYENQQSWRDSHDKLTFILCQPVTGRDKSLSPSSLSTSVAAGKVDSPDRMIGDINFFLYPWDDEDEQDEDGTNANANGDQLPSFCTAEVNIMIANHDDRGRGLGKAVMSTFLHYIYSKLDDILREYQSASPTAREPQLRLKLLMAKINVTNVHSIGLFMSLGFEQEGDVNYFGEVKLVLRDFGRLATPPEGYEVVGYSMSVN